MANEGQHVADRLAFFDIEASGLGPDSFPIEVGWAFASGSSGSFLVRPAPTWTLDAWDPLAEDIHGISYEQVLNQGISPWDAALRLNRLMAPPGETRLTVVSDAVEMDTFWLDRLFEESPEDRAFEVRDVNWLRQVLPPHGDEGQHSSESRIHRAEADARLLMQPWRKP